MKIKSLRKLNSQRFSEYMAYLNKFIQTMEVPLVLLELFKDTHNYPISLLNLVISPVFSDSAHPEQNGKHVRMHRDLKTQQRRLNHFVKEYNHIRSHEALNIKIPADIHDFPTRPFPEKTPHFDYDSNIKILKVTQNGAIKWKSYYWAYLTAPLKGKYVGIENLGNGIWKVFYRNVFLGYFNENELRNKQQSTR